MWLAFYVVEHRRHIHLLLGVAHLHCRSRRAGLLKRVRHNQRDVLSPIADYLIFKRRPRLAEATAPTCRHTKQRADIVMAKHQAHPAHTLGRGCIQ